MAIRPHGLREDTAMNNVPDGYKQTEVRMNHAGTTDFNIKNEGMTGADTENAGMTGVGAYGHTPIRVTRGYRDE